MTNTDDGWAKVYDKRDLDHCVRIGITMGVTRVMEMLKASEEHDFIRRTDDDSNLFDQEHSPSCRLCALLSKIQDVGNERVHGIPPTKAAITPCCGKQVDDLPSTDQLTNDPYLITCEGKTR